MKSQLLSDLGSRQIFLLNLTSTKKHLILEARPVCPKR